MFYSESGALRGGRTRKTFGPAGWVAEDTTKRSDSWLPRREGLPGQTHYRLCKA